MGLTMKDILNMDIMNRAKIRTAKGSYENKVVEWASVIETPVENFTRKNELILSTGINCMHEPHLFKDFVKDVVDSGASGLAIAMGEYISDIPEEVLEFSEERNFSIIELPWEVQFTEITNVIMKALYNEQREELQESEELQQKLLNLILRSTNLSKVAEFVCENIKQPVVITNKSGRIRGKSTNAAKYMNSRHEFLQTSEEPEVISTLKNQQHPLHTRIESIKLDQQIIIQLPIQTAKNIQGYLIVLLPKGASVESVLTIKNVRVLENASTALAMWALRENAIEETELRLRGDFVFSLAKGELNNWDRIYAQAKSLGYDVSIPYICIVGHPENLEHVYRKSTTKRSYKDWIQSMIYYLEYEVFHSANALQRKSMVTFQQGKLIIYYEVLNGPNSENVNSFLDIIVRRLNDLLPGVILSWGIGRYHKAFMSFTESYNDAQTALEIGRHKKGEGVRSYYDETRIDRLLLSFAKSQEMKEVILNTITPLVEYDNQRHMDLIETFKAYNQHQGKVSQTARYLNLHRQSLLYRLKKIESITGLSLVDQDDRFLLDLSIKMWSLGVQS